MVRAKFKVGAIRFNADGGEISMSPVTSGSPENDEFFRYTPYGDIIVGTINRDALAQFKPGQEVYVDFTPIE